MRILALDIGTRRTGVAFLDTAVGVPLAADTLRHVSDEELVAGIVAQVAKRGIDRFVVGLPLLPSGEEGEQSDYVRRIAELLEESGTPVTFLDERYTTPKTGADGDSMAACILLQGYHNKDVDKV